MFFSLFLLVGGFLLALLLFLFFSPVKISLTGKPLRILVSLFFFQMQFDSKFELQISFFRIKKKIFLKQLLGKKAKAKILNVLDKIFSLNKKKTISPQIEKNTKAPQPSPKYFKKKFTTKPNKTELLQLAKKLLYSIHLKKIDLCVSWEVSPYFGILYGIIPLLPTKHQKCLRISFYQATSYQCVLHFCLGSFLCKTIFWYCKILLSSKILPKKS